MAREFKKIWREMEPEEKRALAKKIDSSVEYLSQIAHGHRDPSLEKIKQLIDAGFGLTADMFL